MARLDDRAKIVEHPESAAGKNRSRHKPKGDVLKVTDSGPTPEVERFFASYRDAFNRSDAAGVARHIAAPCLLVERKTTVWSTAEEVLQAMTRLLTLYRESGVERTHFVVERILQQGETDLVANLAWTFDRSQGASWQFRTGYNLRRHDGTWRIVCCTAYEEAEVRQRTR